MYCAWSALMYGWHNTMGNRHLGHSGMGRCVEISHCKVHIPFWLGLVDGSLLFFCGFQKEISSVKEVGHRSCRPHPRLSWHRVRTVISLVCVTLHYVCSAERPAIWFLCIFRAVIPKWVCQKCHARRALPPVNHWSTEQLLKSSSACFIMPRLADSLQKW